MYMVRAKLIFNEFSRHGQQWRIQDLPGGDHGERAEREPKRGSGGSALVGGQGGRAPLKLKAFCTLLYKKVAKS